MSYEVNLDIFEGPLDLLLYLIKKEEINIYDIPIAYITEQYLDYIEAMRWLDVNLAGDYLVMAATLMQIKSRMLLPRPQIEDGEDIEDPRKQLVEQLLEYQRVKEAASLLREKEGLRQDMFSRRSIPEIDEVFEDGEIILNNNVFELLTAFSRALKSMPEDVVHEIIVEHYTVEDKMHELLHMLLDHKRIRVNALFARARSRIELVALFLAVLELTRLGEVLLKQDRAFGDIEIYRNEQVVFS